MITKDKVTEIFCIIDEFDKNLSAEFAKNLRLPSHNSDGKRYRNRKGSLSESEIMTILICCHFGTFRVTLWPRHTPRTRIESEDEEQTYADVWQNYAT